MPKSSHRGLLERTVELLEQAESIELFIPEDTGLFSVDSDHVTQVRQLIGSTIDILREISRRFEELAASLAESDTSADDEDSLLLEIGAQISSEIAAREISDLSFVGRGQLAEIRDTLETAVERKQTWVVASYADSGLRRARKALISLESAISEFEGESAPDRQWTDLEDSLEIRRLYGQFRRAILRGDLEASGEALAKQLQSAARRISILRDLKIYPFLRIDDRLTIRKLNRRIVDWSTSAVESKDEDGRRILQDLVSFARLLGKINEREELREHDRAVVFRLLASTRHQAANAPLRPVILQEIETLLGRDDDLDQILLQPGRHTQSDLRPHLEKLQRELFPGAARGAGEIPSLTS